jgi:hypothetical protein
LNDKYQKTQEGRDPRGEGAVKHLERYTAIRTVLKVRQVKWRAGDYCMWIKVGELGRNY